MSASGNPKIHIRSKNELAKRLSHKGFSQEKAPALINEVLANHDKLWKDNAKYSEPKKNKYVRNARGTPLGLLLRMIDRMVLAPHDKLLPGYVFGGIKGTSHALAARNLLGQRRKRILLKIDIHRYFEQVSRERVADFFRRSGCSNRAAKLLARICCVPVGPKGSTDPHQTIARGFATSSRLAVWCNIGIFRALYQLVQKQLKDKDARLSIYVDDIGITASGVTKADMLSLRIEAQHLLLTHDPAQKLPLNEKKTCIISHEENLHHLGLNLTRKGLQIGARTKSKLAKLEKKIRASTSLDEKKQLQKKVRALKGYKNFIETVGKQSARQ